MPRIAEGRSPAEPTSLEQKHRYARILRVATEHGMRQPMERVQMTEVARDAGVAIATLYRYFPSKRALFTAALHAQVSRLTTTLVPRDESVSAAEAVADVLVRAGEQLLARPLLAQTMLQSNNASVGAVEQGGTGVTRAFRRALLLAADIEAPDDLDERLIRVVEQTWYGIIISVLNGFISAEEAEVDTRMACARLLIDLGEPRPH